MYDRIRRSATRTTRSRPDNRENKIDSLAKGLNHLTDLIGEVLEPEITVKKGDTVCGGYGSRKKRLVTQFSNGDMGLTTLEGPNKGEIASPMRAKPDLNGSCYLDEMVSKYDEGRWEKL